MNFHTGKITFARLQLASEEVDHYFYTGEQPMIFKSKIFHCKVNEIIENEENIQCICENNFTLEITTFPKNKLNMWMLEFEIKKEN